mmetsp:Transcript_27348/g.88319  ORF Transcript_27348/g.88319 Transcript_27348/m.88319 type:complete len:219 (-) Transcript_27348:2034-2690(-)
MTAPVGCLTWRGGGGGRWSWMQATSCPASAQLVPCSRQKRRVRYASAGRCGAPARLQAIGSSSWPESPAHRPRRRLPHPDASSLPTATPPISSVPSRLRWARLEHRSYALFTRTRAVACHASIPPSAGAPQSKLSRHASTGRCTCLTSASAGWGVRSGKTSPLMQNCPSCLSQSKSPPYAQKCRPVTGSVLCRPWSAQSQMKPPCAYGRARKRSHHSA